MKKRIPIYALIVSGIIALVLVTGHILSTPATEAQFFRALPQDRTVVIAHRGGADIFPENTLVSFSGAIELGVDVLEMDIYASADGIPVVIHDATVDRTTNASGDVSSFSFEQLQQLDAAYWFQDVRTASTADEPVYPYRGQNISIPGLEEVFAAFPEIPMIVEIKQQDTRLADTMIELVRTYGREDITLFGSFYPDMLHYFRQHAPEIPTHAYAREAQILLGLAHLRLEGLLSPEYEAVLVPMRSGRLNVTTPRFIMAAQNRGVFTAAWTINRREDMELLIGKGIQGLITDRPDLAMEILGL